MKTETRTKKAPKRNARKGPSASGFLHSPKGIDVLKEMVFSKLLQRRGDEPFRIWVLGCSSGQVAYFVALAFAESVKKSVYAHKLQLFATDLDDTSLNKARQGLYPRRLALDVSRERLRRFFVEEEGGYRVSKSLREMVIFAHHDPFGDPPFSRMDLICCGTGIIRSSSGFAKFLSTCHYALRPGGFLILDTLTPGGAFTDLFEPVDEKHRIYSRLNGATPALYRLADKRKQGVDYHSPDLPRPSHLTRNRSGMGNLGTKERFLPPNPNAQLEADRVTISQFAPPGVLINSELKVLQFRGQTAAYLEPPIGSANFDLLKMARGGLMLPLRATINKAKEKNKIAYLKNVRINRTQNGEGRKVNLKVIPLKKLRERCFLVLFEEGRSRRSDPSSQNEEVRQIDLLERELAETRDYLQVIQEQHDATNEELQAANEEVQSSNEELQSANEELISANEELEQRVAERTKELDSASKRLRSLAQQLVRFQEDERRSILTELHEEIGQQLVGLKLLLEQGGTVAGNERKVLYRSAVLVAEIQGQVQALSSSLRPSFPDFITLRAALECHFLQLERNAGIKVHFACRDLKEDNLSPEIRHALFRIAQAGLTNVVRHAKVLKAKISLSQTKAEVSLEISNQGVGFVPEAFRKNPTRGISGMEERVLLLGGRLVLNSRPGHGTRITVILPCLIQERSQEELDNNLWPDMTSS